jgi:hypothetical protein
LKKLHLQWILYEEERSDDDDDDETEDKQRAKCVHQPRRKEKVTNLDLMVSARRRNALFTLSPSLALVSRKSASLFLANS